MPTRLLGGTTFEVSSIDIGARVLGENWGDVTDDDSIAALRW